MGGGDLDPGWAPQPSQNISVRKAGTVTVSLLQPLCQPLPGEVSSEPSPAPPVSLRDFSTMPRSLGRLLRGRLSPRGTQRWAPRGGPPNPE